MTVSIRRMSLGSGFEYLMNSVARGDGATASSSPLTRYYLESGTPPGRFLGAGLVGLNNGAGVAVGSAVSEQALWRMLGIMADPVTGDPLGRRPQHWPTPLPQRIASRVAALPDGLGDRARAVAVAQIEAEERRREAEIARPVAAFDLTFSVPKSVSTLWALADAATQTAIYRAHQDAIATALAWAEQNVFFTRTCAGGAVQDEVRGVVAAAFDHWDSRAGDPHLHTHVVVANRVQTADGKWRSIDSKTLFRYTVALSELHEGVVHDLLTDRLGVAWTQRARRHSAVPRYDIGGVPDALIEEFSTRTRDIAAAKDELIAAFATEHGRQPTNVEVLKLRQQATLATRPDKQQSTLAQLMATWRDRADHQLGPAATAWTDHVLGRVDVPPLRSADAGDEMLHDLARLVLDAIAHKRATFAHANVLAEVHRQLHGISFASPADRLNVADRTTRFALDGALPLDGPAAPVLAHLLRPDGTSKLRQRGADRYTTIAILDAESRLLEGGRDLHAPAVSAAAVTAASAGLGEDQIAAITSIGTSSRTVDVLVGPAGTGKTTSLAALKTAWESVRGPGSVIGMAPSATAAQVLADELAIPTDNTAKWLTEQGRNTARITSITQLESELATCSSTGTARARRLSRQLAQSRSEHDHWSIRKSQLVIIDEAGLAGTLTLDAVVAAAQRAGGKVLLVGDWAQLGAIEAGGSFHMLATDRADVPTLTQVHRFDNTWEAKASTRLRDGDVEVFNDYQDHDRVHTGDRVAMLHALFDGWRTDTDAGLDSVMIALDDTAVADLNALAQAHRQDTGHTQPGPIRSADGLSVEVGDRIVTRRNDRRLPITGERGWVKNGDLWTITAIHNDGSLDATSLDRRGRVLLPANYVAAHVEPGYAATVHRVQGRTVDTAHALVTHTATREALYVAATRGRTSNHLYVDSELDPDHDTSHGPADLATARQAVTSVLKRTATAASAHVALRRAQPSLDPWQTTQATSEIRNRAAAPTADPSHVLTP